MRSACHHDRRVDPVAIESLADCPVGPDPTSRGNPPPLPAMECMDRYCVSRYRDMPYRAGGASRGPDAASPGRAQLRFATTTSRHDALAPIAGLGGASADRVAIAAI